MSFEQVSHVIRTVEDAFQQVEIAFRHLQTRASSMPERYLVQIQIRHHQRVCRLLHAAFNEPGNWNAGHPWIQFVPTQDLRTAVENVFQFQARSIRPSVEALGDFYLTVIKFLERIREQTTSTQTHQLLDDLKAQVELAGKSLTAGIHGLQDL